MNAPRKFKLLDLFSGIGGFSLGLERTGGFETVAFCEVNPKCRHLLNHHWPEVPVYDDVCTLTGERLAADGITVDAICGGFPCQDISFAGKGAGLAGERSGLWREYSRLIREVRPAVVIVENVAALLGRGLGDVLGDLAALGYDAWWDCIPASAVGAPHRRDRLWIVACARSEQHEGYGDALRRAVAEGLSCAHTLADATSERCGEAGGDRRHEPAERPASGGVALANADSARLALAGLAGEAGQGDGRVKSRPTADRDGGAGGTDDLGNAHGASSYTLAPEGGPRRAASEPSGWFFEPDVGRVAHGVPARVDRLHGLGNAVVPQIPEVIGRAILAARAA